MTDVLPPLVKQTRARVEDRGRLSASAPITRPGLCNLAQPCLRQEQRTPHFQFHDATLLQITEGRLALDDGFNRLVLDSPTSLLLVDANSRAQLVKTPAGTGRHFRSLFLTLSPAVLEAYYRARPVVAADNAPVRPFRQVALNDDLAATLQQLFDGLVLRRLSDERLQYRLMDLLAALADHGHGFQLPRQHSTVDRLRMLMGESPARRWTAHEAGRALAMSEATLRRRLRQEQMRFEALLMDIRMYHGMMLLQTTSWSIPRIAEACGYQSRARFSERFRQHFGYLPSTVR